MIHYILEKQNTERHAWWFTWEYEKKNESLMRYFLKFLISLTDILAETLDKILAEILKITLLKTLHIKQQNLDFANIHRYWDPYWVICWDPVEFFAEILTKIFSVLWWILKLNLLRRFHTNTQQLWVFDLLIKINREYVLNYSYVVTVIEDIQKTACDSWRNLWDTNAFLSDRLEC